MVVQHFFDQLAYLRPQLHEQGVAGFARLIILSLLSIHHFLRRDQHSTLLSVRTDGSCGFCRAADRARRVAHCEIGAGSRVTRRDAFRNQSPSVRADLTYLTR